MKKMTSNLAHENKNIEDLKMLCIAAHTLQILGDILGLVGACRHPIPPAHFAYDSGAHVDA